MHARNEAQQRTVRRSNLKLRQLVLAITLAGTGLSVIPAQAAYIDTPEGFVRQQYRDFLGRDGENEGINYWVAELNAGKTTQAKMATQFFASEEFQNRIAPIARLYLAYFRRMPDYPGLMYWQNQILAGKSLQDISNAFASSQEFSQTYGSLSNEAFINLVYQNVLAREPDAPGKAYWLQQMQQGKNRGEVMTGFSESAEFRQTSYNQIQVTMMYAGMLRREPEESGFNYWVDQLNNGKSPTELVASFLSSPEYRNRFTTLAGLQAAWTQAVDIAATTNFQFLQLNQQWEGGNFNQLGAPAIASLVSQYTTAGEMLQNALNHVNTVSAEMSTLQAPIAGLITGAAGASVPGGGNVPIGLPIKIGQHIQDTKNEVSKCQQLLEDDPNAYLTCTNKLRIEKTLAATGTGLSAIAGTAAGLGAKLIVSGAAFAGSGAAITVGGPLLVGAGVALGVKLLWSYCTSSGNIISYPLLAATGTGEVCHMQTGNVSPGEKVPAMIPGTADLMISIPGYVPVVLKNFTPPANGEDLKLDFDPVPADPNNPGQVITVDYNAVPNTASSCDQISAITASYSPLNPAAYQGVTVTGQLIPAVANCPMNYSIVGTDGYRKSESKTSSSAGTSTFSIPGGAGGVHDVVTISSNNFTYTVTYTFRGTTSALIQTLDGGAMPRVR